MRTHPASDFGRCCRQDGGFTLVEVMAALVILGTSLVVLLDSHFGALSLHDTTCETVFMNELMDWAMGVAETEVQAKTLKGDGDFGKRYEGYAYSFSADLIKDIEGVALFSVNVTVTGGPEPRTMTMLVYNMGVTQAGLDEMVRQRK